MKFSLLGLIAVLVLGMAGCARARDACDSLTDLKLPHATITEAKTVAQAVAEAAKTIGAPVALKGFVRYALGEGIEKQESDFAAEVAAAVSGEA